MNNTESIKTYILSPIKITPADDQTSDFITITPSPMRGVQTVDYSPKESKISNKQLSFRTTAIISAISIFSAAVLGGIIENFETIQKFAIKTGKDYVIPFSKGLIDLLLMHKVIVGTVIGTVAVTLILKLLQPKIESLIQKIFNKRFSNTQSSQEEQNSNYRVRFSEINNQHDDSTDEIITLGEGRQDSKVQQEFLIV